MDIKKFGTFIATMRKENKMTQLDLAKKLQVTDKAVSKWERGLGFPDINTIEPLAEALGVSVLEIMRSERISQPTIPPDIADTALSDMVIFTKEQRKLVRIRVIVLFLMVLLGAVLMCCYFYAHNLAAQNYDVRAMVILEWVLLPLYIAAASCLLTITLQETMPAKISPPKQVRIPCCIFALLLLALYIALLLSTLDILPPFFPLQFVVIFFSGRYLWSAAVGILLTVSFSH